MRWLEVRRHSMTKKGPARGHGSHLSAEGVALARIVGGGFGPIAYVLTSQLPRTLETAVAMGHAVDDTVDVPSGYVPGEIDHHDQWTWTEPYTAYAHLLRRSTQLTAVAEAHRAHWLRAVTSIADGETALVVSHGGTIEPTLVSCLPKADHSAWGAPFGHCDGVRLRFERGSWLDATFSRAA
jgi:broad specificity phosphatase PhoE